MLSSTRCRICGRQGRREVYPPQENPREGSQHLRKAPGQPALHSGPLIKSHSHSWALAGPGALSISSFHLPQPLQEALVPPSPFYRWGS